MIVHAAERYAAEHRERNKFCRCGAATRGWKRGFKSSTDKGRRRAPKSSKSWRRLHISVRATAPPDCQVGNAVRTTLLSPWMGDNKCKRISTEGLTGA